MNSMCKVLLVTAVVQAMSIETVAAGWFSRLTDRVEQRSAYRQHIRSLHILDRPYRFGHFYGNTVRRRHRRQHGTTTDLVRGESR